MIRFAIIKLFASDIWNVSVFILLQYNPIKEGTPLAGIPHHIRPWLPTGELKTSAGEGGRCGALEWLTLPQKLLRPCMALFVALWVCVCVCVLFFFLDCGP